MRILNVGCGPDSYGTDFVDIYPASDRVVKCDVSSEPLPYPDDTFDEVYSRNVLEHLPNPGFALKEMVRVAVPGGSVRVVTDNAGWLPFHLPLRKNNYVEHYSNAPRGGDDDRHYALFTPLHLQNFFKGAGLQVRETTYYYHSKHRAVRVIRPILGFFGRTPLRHLVYPHIRIVGVKPVGTRGRT